MARFQVGAKKGPPLKQAEAWDKHPKDLVKGSAADATVPKTEAKREVDKGKKTK